MSADLPTDYHTAEHAPVWLDYWRPRLRLMDWDVVLEVYGLRAWLALGKNEYLAGYCATSPSCGLVRIRLLDPADLADDIVASCRDVEQTIVHELLHLLVPVKASDGSDHEGERAINRIAQALIRERRDREQAERALRAATGSEVVHEHP
jgi:hypothetical protein